MFDFSAHTPLILSYIFVSLLGLILCFLFGNVAHKIYRSMQAPRKFQTCNRNTNSSSSGGGGAAKMGVESNLHNTPLQCQPLHNKSQKLLNAAPLIEQLRHTKTG